MEPSKFTHKPCSTVNDVGPQVAQSHRQNPKLFVNFYCGKCNKQCPVAEFEPVAGPTTPEPVVEAVPEVETPSSPEQ